MKQKTEKKYLALIATGIFCFLLAGLALLMKMDQIMTGMMISVALIIIGLIFLVLGIRKGIKSDPDYRSLFYVGLTWAVIGLPLDNYILSALGLIFLIIGFINKKKWKEKETWNQLPRAQKWVVGVSMGIGILALIVFAILYFMARGGAINL